MEVYRFRSGEVNLLREVLGVLDTTGDHTDPDSSEEKVITT